MKDLYLENTQAFLICIFYINIPVRAVRKFSFVYWSYISERAKVLQTISLCIFSFVKIKTNMSKQIVNKRQINELATEILLWTRHIKSSKSIQLKFYAVVQHAKYSQQPCQVWITQSHSLQCFTIGSRIVATCNSLISE